MAPRPSRFQTTSRLLQLPRRAPELTAKKIVFRSPGVGIGKDAHHDPTRPHEQHAILRHASARPRRVARWERHPLASTPRPEVSAPPPPTNPPSQPSASSKQTA